MPYERKKREIIMISAIQQAIKDAATNPEYSTRFFKTGEGQYASHDVFIGAPVPDIRIIAKQFKDLDLPNIATLLSSKINEERLLALIILTNAYKTSDEARKEVIFQFYLDNLDHVNNWNLVDSSAHLILGKHLHDKNRDIITLLSMSDNMWRRRVAIVSTYYFIKSGDLDYTFKIAHILLKDKEDLIHKATGWMLREAGKISKEQLVGFLNKHKSIMPRTMLRYAIEKFPIEERKLMMK